MIPTWVCWSLLANAMITFIEYVNRTGGYASFGAVLPHTGLLILIAQAGLFYAWRDASSMMLAWAVFTVGNSAMRLASVTFAVGEVPTPRTLVGICLMLLAVWLVKTGQS